jgi:hypothetical protein
MTTTRKEEVLNFINENPHADLTLVLLSEKAAKVANGIYNFFFAEEEAVEKWGFGINDYRSKIDLDSFYEVIEGVIKNSELVEDVDYLIINF